MAITKVIRDFQWNRCHVLEHKVSFQILRDTSNIHTWQNDTIGEANGWLFDSQCLVEGKMPKKKRDYSSCESNFSNCKPLKSRQKVREVKFDEVVSKLEVFFSLFPDMFGWHWSTLHVPGSGNFLIFYFALFYSWPWPTCNLPNLPDCEKKSWFCPAAAALPRLLRFSVTRDGSHPRRPRGSKSGWEKGRDESFQIRVKEPLGTDSHQTTVFPKIQADAGSWLGTKNVLYYCAQLANSFSWVLFVNSYTTAIVLPHLPSSFTKLVRARETFIFYFPNQKRRNYRCAVEKTFGMLSTGAIQFAPRIFCFWLITIYRK